MQLIAILAASFLSSVEWRNIAVEVSEVEGGGLFHSHEYKKQLRAIEHPPLCIHDVICQAKLTELRYIIV